MKHLLAFTAAMLLAAPAVAQQQQCASVADVFAQLENRYSEVMIGMGRVSDTQRIAVTASQDGTWTVVVIHHDGMACLVTSGDQYEYVELPFPAEGTDG